MEALWYDIYCLSLNQIYVACFSKKNRKQWLHFDETLEGLKNLENVHFEFEQSDEYTVKKKHAAVIVGCFYENALS